MNALEVDEVHREVLRETVAHHGNEFFLAQCIRRDRDHLDGAAGLRPVQRPAVERATAEQARQADLVRPLNEAGRVARRRLGRLRRRGAGAPERGVGRHACGSTPCTSAACRYWDAVTIRCSNGSSPASLASAWFRSPGTYISCVPSAASAPAATSSGSMAHGASCVPAFFWKPVLVGP